MTNYPLHPYDSAQNQRPTALIGLGNGFPPQMYQPLAQALGKNYYPVCLPPRPWWKNEKPEDFLSWHQLADDLIGGIRQHQLAPVVAIGHSMSGVAFTYAAVKAPELFRALILLDPVNLPPHIIWLSRLAALWGRRGPQHLIQGALKRRRKWESQEEAYQRFRGRSLFARCSDEVVRLYAEGITKATDSGVELAYSPEWEARIFERGPFDVWQYPKRLRLPTLVLGAAESDTFWPSAQKAWQKRRPDIPVVIIPQTGHLLPFEEPQTTAYHILNFLAKLEH